MKLDGVLGILGFGNMGRALAAGLVQKGTFSPSRICVYDVDPAKCMAAQDLNLRVAGSSAELVGAIDYLMLAVKPQSMEGALSELRTHWTADVLVLSIAAGISTEYIRHRLGDAVRVVRVMPNTPAMVLAGAAGVALGAGCGAQEAEIARAIFESVGVCEIVPEKDMDIVTALSGSGPAYFFYMVECLVKAAVAHGLPEKQAASLAAQTLLGAGRLLTESGEAASTLRERVTSKGGTTEAALKRFREADFEGVVVAGVSAAAARSKELGK